MSKLQDKVGSRTTSADLENLTVLGQRVEANRALEVFPSHSRPGDLEVTVLCREFTCRCPKTEQPDWAEIEIVYCPDKVIVESKSVKLYMETWREEGIFHEHLAQVVLGDFVTALKPLSCRVTVFFNVRGGIEISAAAEYERK
jgi:7-cyano-7-deazaguanine reductase